MEQHGEAVAPLHGDDPLHVRLARHATGISVLVVGAAGMGVAGLFPPTVPWWVPSTALLVGSVLIAAVYTSNPGASARDVNVRAAVQSIALAVVTYATGWGFALPFAHLFGIADNINESGSDAGRVSLVWAVTVTTVAQLAVQSGFVPLAAITVGSSHLVAGVTVVLLSLVTARLRSASRERERARADLARSERRFRTLIEDATDVVMLLGRDLTITYASPTIERVFGLHDEDVAGRSYVELVHDDDAARVAAGVHGFLSGDPRSSLLQFRVTRGDGSSVAVEASHRDLFDDPDVSALLVSVRDVSERLLLEEAVEHGRNHDAHTGLPNRRAFAERLDALVRGRGVSGLALLAVDLDGVEAIAQTGGPEVVDDVVAAVAFDLVGALPEAAVISRTGEARFALVVGDVEGIDALHGVAERLMAAVARTVELPDASLQLRGVVGMVTATTGSGGRDLLGAAEIAVNAARASSSGTTVFDESLRQELRDRLATERDLGRALTAGDEWRVHFQPLVALDGDEPAGDEPRLVGVEALVRWQHPTRGMVSPGEFVPLAEETGMIVEIGWWVLDAALAQLAEWDVLLGTGTVGYVSVNVSMLQFAGGELARRVEDALTRHRLSPHRLLLELTESVLARDPESTVPQLSVITGMGVQLAIDDFGTGYSSMAYLQQFPVDVLKIDRAFVSTASDAYRPELLASLRQLGRALGLRTVAEGIETVAELAAVRDLSFEVGQGYLFGRPMEAADLTAAIRSRQRAASSDGAPFEVLADDVGPPAGA